MSPQCSKLNDALNIPETGLEEDDVKRMRVSNGGSLTL
jgi:hypothetical protein